MKWKREGEITHPLVHLNGTSREALTTANIDASSAIRGAIRVLEAAEPNARDYYPLGPDAWTAARAEHVSRIERLRDVLAEVYAIVEVLSDGDDRSRAVTAPDRE